MPRYEKWYMSLCGTTLFSIINSIINKELVFDKNYINKYIHQRAFKKYFVEIYFKKINYCGKTRNDVKFVCEISNFFKFIDFISSKDIVYIFFVDELRWFANEKIVEGIVLYSHSTIVFDRKENKKNLIMNKKYWSNDYQDEFEFHRGDI